YLFFLRKDVLIAQPFDLKRHQLTGEPRVTVERVLYDSSIWKLVFDVSESGVMAYELGSAVSGTQLRWFDRTGKQFGTVGDYAFQFEPRLSKDGLRLADNICRVGYEYGKVWVYDLRRGIKAQITLDRYASGSPAWFPDGNRIFFAGKREHYAIYEVDSSGSGPERLILDTGAD